MHEDRDAAATPSRPGAAREGRLAFVLYLLLAIVATYPLVRRPGDHVLGHVELESTPRLNAWAMAFVRHQLVRDPVHLFDGNAFHPYRRTLALSEHLFVPALLGAPVSLLTGNDVLAYNAVTLVTFAFAGLGAFLLARHLGVSAAAAVLAGIVYAFHSWNVNEVVRIQILSNQWFPFLVWAIVRFYEEPTGRRAVVAGLFYGLQSLSCMYWALYLPLLVGPLVAHLQWRRRLPFARLRTLALGLLPPVALTALFAIPYVQLANELGLQRDQPQALDLARYLDVLPGNPLYASALGTAGRNQNAAHFLGFTTMALAAYGALRGRLQPASFGMRLFCAALAAAGFVLSLGPHVVAGGTVLAPAPYGLLYDWMPGFRNVRYPERFSLFLVLGLAPLAAAGLDALRTRIGNAGAAVLCAFAFVEHLAVPHVLTPMPTGAGVPAAHRWIAGRSDIAVVAEVPSSRHRMERLDALPMWLSATHWKRTLQGFTGYFPPTYNLAKWRLFHFPAPASVTFLTRFGVDAVVVHPTDGVLPAWAAADPRWTVEGPFEGGHVVLRLHGAGENPFAPVHDEEALAEIPREGWQVQASYPGAARAIDGDAGTSWSTHENQGRGDFYRVRFREAVTLLRISLDVRAPYEFPTSLKVMAETDAGTVELPYDTAAAYDRLTSHLLHRPRNATLDIDIAPTLVRAVRLRVTETDAFWMPWTLAEIRAFAPAKD